jgi:hypothetical protein
MLTVGQAQRKALTSNVVGFVTFYYRQNTMHYLARVLSNLSDFIVEKLQVNIVTNSDDPAHIQSLERIARTYLREGECSILSRPNVTPPQFLTWEHKESLRTSIIGKHPRFTHFIYLEDDADLTFRNFIYFLQSSDFLKERGFIPSFARTEFNYQTGCIYSCDAVEPTRAVGVATFDDVTFASPDYPYCGGFIMDREAADEYIGSRSFDIEQSAELCDWGPMERASMGLCWENPPTGFKTRYVLPINRKLKLLPMCQVAHMPNKFANASEFAPSGKLGKLLLSDVFYQ